MIYQCPKGHQSTDSDYCSECGALIGQSNIVNIEPIQNIAINNPPTGTQEICPDCGTPREGNGRFCEVCRHDFQENKTGVAEVIVASQQASKPVDNMNISDTPGKKPLSQHGDDLAKAGIAEPASVTNSNANASAANKADEVIKATTADTPSITQKLNIIISVDNNKVSSWDGESPIKPDTTDRVFPLDLDENLVGRRSQGKGVYPEIEINDPGVSRRHLKFIKQSDGSFGVLELGSANGTELNGAILEPGVSRTVKSGDELTLGIWTRLKIEAR